MQIKTERDYVIRDRTAIVGLVIGVALILWWVIAGVTTGEATGGIIALLGLVLVINGYVFYKRR